MRYLLDTGVLVRVPHRSDPMHSDVRGALRQLVAAGHTFVTTRQNIAEFWNVCTRPAQARGGFGLSTDEAAKRLRLLERSIEVLRDADSAYQRWKLLVTRYKVQGRQVHDARIVAVMSAYRIKRIVTLNVPDFSRYREVEAVSPRDVLSATP
jgi:predicted nucleic acid-binding protein